jgi:hypothetical protein
MEESRAAHLIGSTSRTKCINVFWGLLGILVQPVCYDWLVMRKSTWQTLFPQVEHLKEPYFVRKSSKYLLCGCGKKVHRQLSACWSCRPLLVELHSRVIPLKCFLFAKAIRIDEQPPQTPINRSASAVESQEIHPSYVPPHSSGPLRCLTIFFFAFKIATAVSASAHCRRLVNI